jgi:hypothetical protein
VIVPEGIESERALCRFCAQLIYRPKLPTPRPWRHTDSGKTTCVDMTGHGRRARPTRLYEETNDPAQDNG